MTPKRIDFAKVESLRRHMLLTVRDLTNILGVSRTTYYGWLSDKPVRKSSEASIRVKVRHLLLVMSEHNWPSPEIIGLEPKQRVERLIALLEKYR